MKIQVYVKKMLNYLGAKTLDSLIENVIPKNILTPTTENLIEKDLNEFNFLINI